MATSYRDKIKKSTDFCFNVRIVNLFRIRHIWKNEKSNYILLYNKLINEMATKANIIMHWLKHIITPIIKDKYLIVFIGLFVFCISYFFTFDIMRFSKVMGEYSKNYNLGIKKNFRNDIVLVEFIDTVNNDTICDFVEKLVQCDAAVIGIDIHFNKETNGHNDSIRLDNLVKKYPNIVFSYKFDTSGKEYVPDYSYFIKSYDDANMGFSNLIDIGGIACAHKRFIEIDDVKYPSFATKMAEIYSGKNISSFINKELPINYDYAFDEYSYSLIYDDDYINFKDKCVIIGLDSDIPNSPGENAKGYYIQGCILASTIDNMDNSQYLIAILNLLISILIVSILTILSEIRYFKSTIKTIFIFSMCVIIYNLRDIIGISYIYSLIICVIAIIVHQPLYELRNSLPIILKYINNVLAWLKKNYRKIVPVLALTYAVGDANAQYTPVVNICMEKHNGSINHMEYNREGKYIATVSEDKSVRIWNAKKKSLINTIYMPEGEGGEGVLYTCVFHPKMENIILAAGNTGAKLESLTDGNYGEYYFYVIDWRKGIIIDKIGTFRREIKYMVYSPDCRFLIMASDYEDVYIFNGHKLVKIGYLNLKKEIISDIYFEGKDSLVITTNKYRRTFKNLNIVKKEKNRKKNFIRDTDTADYSMFKYREKTAPSIQVKENCLLVEYKNETTWKVSRFDVERTDKIYSPNLGPITSKWVHDYFFDIKTDRWIDENSLWPLGKLGSKEKGYIRFYNKYFLKSIDSKIDYIVPYKCSPIQIAEWINDSFFIISHDDGIIRWYDKSNGKEVLALFIDRKGNWIYWVPEGYFYSEPASNSFLIEWKMQYFTNVIVKKPDKVRHNFYSKSFIFKRLDEIYKGKSIESVNNNAITNLENIMSNNAPIIKIDSVVIDREWYIYYSLDNYKGKVYGIYSIIPEINDKKVNFRFIEQTDNEGIIVAETADTTGKVCLYLHSELNGQITWDDYKLEKTKIFNPKNVRLAGFGISKYSKPSLNKLESCINDVYDFSGVLESYFYEKGNKRIDKVIGCNEEVTTKNIYNTMDSLYYKSGNEDITIFFFSGHGIKNEKDGKYYLVTYDADNRKKERGIDAELLMEKINRINGYKIIFVDACFSGHLINKTYKKMSIFVSSRNNQESFASNNIERSVFTNFIVRYFNSISESRTDVDLLDLANFLKDMTERYSKGKQNPVFSISDDTDIIKL